MLIKNNFLMPFYYLWGKKAVGRVTCGEDNSDALTIPMRLFLK